MTAWKSNWQTRKGMIIIVLLLVGVMMALAVPVARAQGVIYSDNIAPGETIENDLILFGDDVRMEGGVEGDFIAVGNRVEITGEVEGSVVAIGQSVLIDGQIQGSSYTAGLIITLGSGGNIGRNLYSASLELDMQDGSQVQRDVYAASPGGATLQAEIGRNFVGMIGPVEYIRLFIRWIEDLTGADFFTPLIPQSSTSQEFYLVSEYAQAGLIPFNTELIQQAGTLQSEEVIDWLLARLRELITLLALGALGMWLLPISMERTFTQARIRFLSAFGWGLLVILAGAVLFLLALVALVLVALFFFALTLAQLGSIVLSIGLFFLGAVTAVFVFLVALGSKVIVSILIGKVILERLAPETERKWIWPLLLGVFIYVLLRAIPFLGWIFGVLATLLGVGAMWLAFQDMRKKTALQSAVVDPMDGEPAVEELTVEPDVDAEDELTEEIIEDTIVTQPEEE